MSPRALVPLFLASGEVAQSDRSCGPVAPGGTTMTLRLAHFRLACSRQMFVVACPRAA